MRASLQPGGSRFLSSALREGPGCRRVTGWSGRAFRDTRKKLRGMNRLKIPFSELPDSQENIRSALSRATKQKEIDIATSSDEDFLYV